ncbi:hypothetical protein HYPBUDRAFT_200762 [Hyphopichia burtonii NRRL Y-1933]|uniref:Uncharacterized protein n=1 Tax=Hyphopichia burtonii NRRL Y-1933 TaxID=984485 RepID=A0A1E4RL00_9ASCO|nr:hypothetical protein HYPBUDRAFT_200762 [Hyphopichia burtonii NRRL Y-1933]ODV67949.1 hypothetical protein HYPBUDRAFT_200762 [Hyphopichia burtonii NRRL Y-1933]
MIFIINLESQLVSYLLALALRTHFARVPQLKIVVLEHDSKNHDFKPWCGINTFNNYHFVNDNTIASLLSLLLGNDFDIHRMDSVRLKPLPAANFNMDKPLNELMEIKLSYNNYLGLIYHPILIVNKLRTFLINSNIVLTTVWNNGQFLSQMAGTYPQDQIIQLNSNIFTYNNLMVNSNLTQVVYQNVFSKKPPSSLLWIPKFKTGLGKSNFEINVHRSGKLTHINLLISNHLDLDLYQVFKMIDIYLNSLDQLSLSGDLNLNFAKF